MNPWGLFIIALAVLLVVLGLRNDFSEIVDKLRGSATPIPSANGGAAALTAAAASSPPSETNGYGYATLDPMATSTGAPTALPPALDETVNEWVQAQVPYQWGGMATAPGQGIGADCSRYVEDLLASVGINVGRTTYQQVNQGQGVIVTGAGGLSDAVAGDVLFFDGNAHEGMYLGNGEMTDEPHTGGHAEIVPVAGYGVPDAIRRFLSTTTIPSSGTVLV